MKADALTRARLLATAEQLFAERGFKAVTVREICSAAEANLAAVNYHFGDKLGLYREVLRGATAAMRETNEAARAAGKGQPADEQLRRYVHVFLERVLRKGNRSIHRLITREMHEPTEALDTLVEEGVRPRIEYLCEIVSRILACDRKDPRVLRCVASLQYQVLAYFPNPISKRLGFIFEPTPAQIAEVAEHIATFSLGGMRALARSSPRPS